MESNQLFKLAVVTVYVEIKNNCILINIQVGSLKLSQIYCS